MTVVFCVDAGSPYGPGHIHGKKYLFLRSGYVTVSCTLHEKMNNKRKSLICVIVLLYQTTEFNTTVQDLFILSFDTITKQNDLLIS